MSVADTGNMWSIWQVPGPRPHVDGFIQACARPALASLSKMSSGSVLVPPLRTKGTRREGRLPLSVPKREVLQVSRKYPDGLELRSRLRLEQQFCESFPESHCLHTPA